MISYDSISILIIKYRIMKSSRLPYPYILVVLFWVTLSSNFQSVQLPSGFIVNTLSSEHQVSTLISPSQETKAVELNHQITYNHFSAYSIESLKLWLKRLNEILFPQSQPNNSQHKQREERIQEIEIRKQSVMEQHRQQQNSKQNLRNLQTQLIEEKQSKSNQNLQITTTISQTTSSTDKKGEIVATESSTVTKDTTSNLSDSERNFGFTSKIETDSLPKVNGNIIGFQTPFNGVFTQTTNNLSSSSRTRTTKNSSIIRQNKKQFNGTSNSSVISSQSIRKANNFTNTREQTTLTNRDPKTPEGFSNEPNKTVESNTPYNKQFSSIQFYHPLPQQFLLDQLFMLRGRVTKDWPSNQQLPITILFMSKQSSEEFSCDLILEPGIKQFNYGCQITKEGPFYLSVIVGSESQVAPFVRSVFAQIDRTIKQIQKPQPTDYLTYKFKDNKLVFQWNSRHPITKLSITQQKAANIYQFSNFRNSFQIDFKDFRQFTPGKVTKFSVQEAYSASGSARQRNSQFSDPKSLQFIALQAENSQYNRVAIEINEMPWLTSKNTQLIVQGKSQISLSNSLFVVTPDGQIEVSKIVDKDEIYIAQDVAFNIEVNVSIDGIYTLYMNSADDTTVLMRPFYIYTPSDNQRIPGIPLILI